MEYRYRPDLLAEIVVPEEGILSRPLHNDERVRVVLFGFSEGQELSEHTASTPAILHVLQGEARLGLGGDFHEVKAGAWVYMSPHLPHRVVAKTPLILLLTLIKTGSSEEE